MRCKMQGARGKGQQGCIKSASRQEGRERKKKGRKRREEGTVIILDIYFGHGEWGVDPQSVAT